MDNVTFREVKISQSEAEKELPEKSMGLNVKPYVSVNEIDRIVPPLSIYEEVKGRPAVVDYLDVGDYLKISENNPNAEKTLGNLNKKIGIIEGWVENSLKHRYLDDTYNNFKTTMKMIDKLINFSSTNDPIERVNKIYSFILSSNKSRAFKRLREALSRQEIDKTVNLENLTADTMGKFLPRS